MCVLALGMPLGLSSDLTSRWFLPSDPLRVLVKRSSSFVGRAGHDRELCPRTEMPKSLLRGLHPAASPEPPTSAALLEGSYLELLHLGRLSNFGHAAGVYSLKENFFFH